MKPEQLKNILPLCMGQKVEIAGQERILSALFLPSALSNIHEFGSSAFLLLRPLSSMTEEEAKGICDGLGLELEHFANRTHYFTIDFRFCDPHDSGSYYVRVYNDGTLATDDTWAAVPASIIPHLTSLGFDCFGLIHAGIAKDLTQIKQS